MTGVRYFNLLKVYCSLFLLFQRTRIKRNENQIYLLTLFSIFPLSSVNGVVSNFANKWQSQHTG